MLKALTVIGFLLLAGALIASSFYILQMACSLPERIESSADKNAETTKASKNEPGKETKQVEPSATFDLRVTEPNKIEGHYYTEDAGRGKNSWTQNFFCETKVGEFAIACFTFFLVVFTALLWWATEKQIAISGKQILISEKQSVISEDSIRITRAVQTPIPLISAFKLVQYEMVPGDVSILDPVPGGFIPPNCRILFIIENKGQFILRCTELSLERFIGQRLPDSPLYRNVHPWGLHLERGPIWIRSVDEQGALTPEETARANAAYPQGALWVYGYVNYLGLLDEALQYRFLWRWDLNRGFVPEIRPDYSSGATVT